jgi:hypothetical protein
VELKATGTSSESRVPRSTWLRLGRPRFLLPLAIGLALLTALAGGYAASTRSGAGGGAGASGLILGSSAPSGDLRPGGEARVSAHLLDLALPLTIQVLATYSDGSTQYLQRKAATTDVIVTWTIPPGAPPGPARLRLFAVRTCQCGGPYPPPEDSVEGQFQVHPNG